MKQFTVISILLLVLALSFHLHAQDANALLGKMDDIIYGPQDKVGKVKIILVDKSGKEKIREAAMYQKGRDKKLYRYTKPEKQAGMATLALPGNVMWLYMPSYDEITKITFIERAFTGTDFSYEDMATSPYADRYTSEFVETKGNTNILKLTPRGKSQYSQIVLTQDRTHHYPILMEYYDKRGLKFKEAKYKYQQGGKYWYAEEVIMTNLKKNHSTKIYLFDLEFDQGLNDKMFEIENLRPTEQQQGN